MSDSRTINLTQTIRRDELAIIVLHSLEVSFTSFQFVNNMFFV